MKTMEQDVEQLIKLAKDWSEFAKESTLAEEKESSCGKSKIWRCGGLQLWSYYGSNDNSAIQFDWNLANVTGVDIGFFNSVTITIREGMGVKYLSQVVRKYRAFLKAEKARGVENEKK